MDIIRIYKVWKPVKILLINCLQLVIEMLPVFITFLYEHLSIAMFDLYRKERSSARGWSSSKDADSK